MEAVSTDKSKNTARRLLVVDIVHEPDAVEATLRDAPIRARGSDLYRDERTRRVYATVEVYARDALLARHQINIVDRRDTIRLVEDAWDRMTYRFPKTQDSDRAWTMLDETIRGAVDASWEAALRLGGVAENGSWQPVGFNLERARAEYVEAVERGEKHALEFLPLLGCDGYVWKNGSTLIASPPKGGKTEAIAASVKDWHGERIVWLSEEGRYIWEERATQHPPGTFRRVCVEPCLGAPVSWLLQRIEHGHESVVVIDTIRYLLAIEDENDNAKVQRALAPFVTLCRRLEKTLILLHHSRKAEGRYGERVAGAAAFIGIVDVVLEIERDQAKPESQRILRGVARLFQPKPLLYEQKRPGVIVALGSPDEQKLKQVMRRALAVLLLDGKGSTTSKVYEAVERGYAQRNEKAPSHRTIDKALARLATPQTEDDGALSSPRVRRDPPITSEAKGKTVRWWRLE